jgi:hypothetical protein
MVQRQIYIVAENDMPGGGIDVVKSTEFIGPRPKLFDELFETRRRKLPKAR